MATFEDMVSALDPDDHVRGKQFERICKWFLEHDPTYADQLDRVWLWDEWPGGRHRDIGIDLVAESKDGSFWAIQSKCYAEDASVTKRDMDSFLAASASPRFSFRLLITTGGRISANALHAIADASPGVAYLTRDSLSSRDLPWLDALGELPTPPSARKKIQARPHQVRAIKDVLDGFAGADRGQLVMACGTGKTMTALWIAETLGASRILVLVPSLSLLGQTLGEWTSNRSESFEFLAVCSDESVTGDTFTSSTAELGLPATTDPNAIARFLRNPGHRVVFATYASSPRIAEAFSLGSLDPFDLAIADEAHRCAGKVGSNYATILDAGAIRARKRLFMTATPRYFTGRLIKEAVGRDLELASMDDEKRFGPVFHKLTFGQAIDQELLCDYRVVIVSADLETLEQVRDRDLVTVEGKPTDAATLAAHVAIAKTMGEYDLLRVITFHSRVTRASDFSKMFPVVLSWLPAGARPDGDTFAAYVSGLMPASERRAKLNLLKGTRAGERALLANARCLSEGVDVPTLDGVAFVDPRQSEIDVVQAVGRAIRLAPDKKVGTIILPVAIDPTEDPEEALETGKFKVIWQVIEALRAHDDALAQWIDDYRVALGRGGDFPAWSSKIRIDLPEEVSVRFADAIRVRLVEQTSARWEFWFGVLERFSADQGTSRVPDKYREPGLPLGQWVHNQRQFFKSGRLSRDRSRRLESLHDWTWDAKDQAWEDAFAALQRFADENGHAAPSKDRVVDDMRLGQWVANQRMFFRSGRLGDARRARLQAVRGWAWNTKSAAWEQAFAALSAFAAREGHARVPRECVEGDVHLGQWVQGQRRSYGLHRLPANRVLALEALHEWSWNSTESAWERSFAHLRSYVDRWGNARVPDTYVEAGFKLGQWVGRQRQLHAKGSLPADRAAKLGELPEWIWDPRDARWETGFRHLLQYAEREGNALVPRGHREGENDLGGWVITQRQFKKQGRLDAEREARLQAVKGWSWDPFQDRWEQGFEYLLAYVARTGEARVPRDHIEGTYRLGSWVREQRQKEARGSLAVDRVRRLRGLPGWV